MNELSYRAMVWLIYRLGATVALGLPLVLLVWSIWRQEPVVQRLMGLYWKVASLMVISLLLLTDERPIGFVTVMVAPVLMAVSVWFWVDLNEELADQPLWRPLPLTVRLWRWAFSGFALLSVGMSVTSLGCLEAPGLGICAAWLEAPQRMHQVVQLVFDFVFGGDWTPTVAGFLGYAALVVYLAGALQWLLVRLPRYGRVAGEF